jgi:translocation and assembly module TamB
MADEFKKTGRRLPRLFLRGMLTLALFLVVVVALIHLGLIIGVSYLNSGKAHAQMQAYISSLLSQSGYEATFDAVSYYPARGLGIRNLRVADRRGVFLKLDQAALTVDFAKIPLHTLDISLTAGTAEFLRLPESRPNTDKSPALEPFALPDIYFKNIEISSLSIKRLMLDPSIAGTPLAFSPSLEASVRLAPEIEIEASLSLEPQEKMGVISLPDQIRLTGSFTPATLAFNVSDFAITSPDYTFSGAGTGSIAPQGQLDLNIKTAYPDLKPLSQENFESGFVDLQLHGSASTPVIAATGVIKPAALKDRGLADINFAIKPAEDRASGQADLKISTEYKDTPAALTGIFSYTPDLVRLNQLNLKAPQIDITGQVSLPLDTLLPTAQLSLTADDLSYYKDLLQVEVAGMLKADINLVPRDTTLSADIKAQLKAGRYDTLHAASLDIETSFPNIAQPWPDAADARISGLQITETISVKNATINLIQKGADRYGLTLSGDGKAPMPVSFKGSADIAQIASPSPQVTDINLITTLNKSSLRLTGDVSAEKMGLALTTSNFLAADIPFAMPEAVKDIRVSGDVTITGPLAAPVSKANLKANGFGGKYKSLLISAEASHQAGQATLSLKGSGTGIKALQAGASIPVAFSLSPFVLDMNSQTDLQGNFMAELELGGLSPLFLPAPQSLEGNLKASGKVGGTVSAPDLEASIALTDGSFTDEVQGIELGHMTAEAILRSNRLILNSLTATDNEAGRLNAKGDILLSDSGSGAISLSLKNFHLPKSQMANGHIDADLSLASEPKGFSASGKIDIAEMNITIPESFTSNIPELNIMRKKKEKTQSLSTALAIKVNAPNQVFVRGWGLDAEFGGEIDITGDASAPQFNGTLSSKRGRFEEFGKRFALARADLRFQGEVPPSPYLDVEATTPSGDITASVLLSGPVTKPAITFSSSPALPQDEVLSRILFNKDSSKITPFQAIQLAQMIQRFSGKGSGSGFDPLGKLRAATGLDDISVDTDASGQTNVGVGKYLTDKVYLEVQKGKAANSGNATIQIEVTPQINIQSEIGQESQTGGGIFWKRDY